MFKNISVKAKIIIFAIVSLIGIFIIAKTAIENNERQKQLKVQLENEIAITEKIKEKWEEENKIKELERIRLEDQKKEQKKLQEAKEEKYNRAFQLYSKEGKYTETIKLMEEIISEDGEFYKAYNLKGIALCYLGAARGDGGKFEEGIASINEALQIKSDYGYAAFTMGEAYGLYGYYDNAIEWYNKAINLEPEYAWNYYGIARVYARKNDSTNAVKYLKRAIEKDSSIKTNVISDNSFYNVKNSSEFNDMMGN